MRSDAIRDVIRAYDDAVVRAYCWGRFWILRQRFLDEIGQYLPEGGRVLDLGCGFGLFSLYYARVRPGLSIHGVDVNARRIGMARAAAARLHLGNVRYEEAVRPLLEQLAKILPAGRRLVIKDVDRRPAYKRWFTHALDRVMDPRTPVRYWDAAELQGLLERVGFTVHRHLMVDILPYPHVLYVCQRQP